MEFPKAPTPSEVKDAADEALDDGVDAAEEIVETVVEAVQNAGNDAGSAAVGGAQAVHEVVQSDVRRTKAILNVVDGFVNSISNIAAGNTRAAAEHTEHALAAVTTVLIGFLGNLVGLGGVSSRVQSAVRRVRVAVDNVLDWGIRRAVGVASHARETLSPYAGALRDLAQHAGSDAEHSRSQVVRILERLKVQARPEKKAQPSQEAPASEPVDVKRAEAMLGRLARIERSLHKLEMAMLRKGARFKNETAALVKLRTALLRQRQHLTAQLTLPRMVHPLPKPRPVLGRR